MSAQLPEYNNLTPQSKHKRLSLSPSSSRREPSTGIVHSPPEAHSSTNARRVRQHRGGGGDSLTPTFFADSVAHEVLRLENEVLARRNAELSAALQARFFKTTRSPHGVSTAQHISVDATYSKKKRLHRDRGSASSHHDNNSFTVAEALTEDEDWNDQTATPCLPSKPSALSREVKETSVPESEKSFHCSAAPPVAAAAAGVAPCHHHDIAPAAAGPSTPDDVATLSRGLHDLTLRVLFLCAEWMPSSSVELASVISGGSFLSAATAAVGVAPALVSSSPTMSPAQWEALHFFSQHAHAIQHLEAVVRSRFAAEEECIAASDAAVRSLNIEAQDARTLHQEVLELRQEIATRDTAIASSADYLARGRVELNDCEALLRQEQQKTSDAHGTIAQLSHQLLELERKNTALEDAMAHLQLHLMKTPIALEEELPGPAASGEVTASTDGDDDPRPHLSPPLPGMSATMHTARTPYAQQPNNPSLASNMHDERIQGKASTVGILPHVAPDGLRTELLVKVLRSINTTTPSSSLSPEPYVGNNVLSDDNVSRVPPLNDHHQENIRVTKLAREIFDRAMQQRRI